MMCNNCMGWGTVNGGCMIHNTVPVGCKDFCAIHKLDEDNKRKWIPVSERFPETGTTSYLVCLKNGGIFLAVFLPGEEFRQTSTMRKFCENNPVVAWQPLPAPYEVKSDE